MIQNNTHRVIGHVLAWCERNRIAYICPMEVLLEDIKRTLGAKRIYLPGSAEQRFWVTKASRNATHTKEDSKIGELEISVRGLGIVDEGVVVDGESEGRSHSDDGGESPVSPGTGPTRSRLGMLHRPPIAATNGESDKENLPVLNGRILRGKDERELEMEMDREMGLGKKGLEVVGVP